MHWWCCCTWVCASSTDCTHWLGEVGTSGNLVDVQCSSRHHLCLSCPSQRGAKPDGPTLIAFENYIENYEGKLYWRNLSENYAAGSISIESHCKAQHFRVISSKLHIFPTRALPSSVERKTALKLKIQIIQCAMNGTKGFSGRWQLSSSIFTALCWLFVPPDLRDLHLLYHLTLPGT